MAWIDGAAELIAQRFKDEPLVNCQATLTTPLESFMTAHKGTYVHLLVPEWIEAIEAQGPEALRGVTLARADVYERDWNGYGHHVKRDVTVPKTFGMDDAALFLVLTGKLHAPVPLGLALAMTDGQNVHPWSLAEDVERLRVGKKPNLQELELSVDEDTHDLCVGEWEKKRIAPLFRRRTEQAGGHSAGTGWMVDGQIVCAKQSEKWRDAAKSVGFNVVPYSNFIPDLSDLLAKGRSGEEMPDTVAGRIARAVFEQYEPLTGNLPAIREDSPEAGMSAAVALDCAKPVFAELADAPLQGDPEGAVTKLLAILIKMKRGHVPDVVIRSAGVRHAWSFQFRTTDHTWLRGQILRTGEPVKITRAEPMSLPRVDCSGAMRSRYSPGPWSAWFGTTYVRCRVREVPMQ